MLLIISIHFWDVLLSCIRVFVESKWFVFHTLSLLHRNNRYDWHGPYHDWSVGKWAWSSGELGSGSSGPHCWENFTRQLLWFEDESGNRLFMPNGRVVSDFVQLPLFDASFYQCFWLVQLLEDVRKQSTVDVSLQDVSICLIKSMCILKCYFLLDPNCCWKNQCRTVDWTQNQLWQKPNSKYSLV